MSRWGRKFGVAGFLLSVGLACTQLVSSDRPNTLAPAMPRPLTPNGMSPPPGSAGSEPAAMGTCVAGQFQCSGALLQTCADDLTSWVTVRRCAAAALCQAQPGQAQPGQAQPGQAQPGQAQPGQAQPGQVEPATCLAPSCGEEEMSCAGAVLQRCNADRNGWDVFATCLSPAHCNADLRQCMPEPCNPGDRRCDRSEVDQSPVLETCQDDRQDWAQLDTCATRELCEQTLNPAIAPGGGLVVGSDGMVQLAAPEPLQVTACLLPVCAAGEVRCDGTQLQYCAEGRTGFVTAEDCASLALCQASVTNFTSTGAPACLPPVCAAGEHQCTEGGVLQVCNEERTGFRVIQTCIGAAFCNATLANQGLDGCRSTPCEAGQAQCNGAQIQVCRADQSGFDNSGPPCESAALCNPGDASNPGDPSNASDPLNAFCETPTCRRGATAADEFRCVELELQRCNESLTGYDTIDTCVTAALCDASQRFDGCQPPLCEPGQNACSEGFLQVCNADQTGFENLENCGSQAACDANAGRCADPCEPGSVRCNEQSGDLEECIDLLTGWQTTADCLSLPLCDAQNRRCNPPVCAAGARRCETRGDNPVVTQCAAGREAFDVVRTCATDQLCDSPNDECDVCSPNAVRCEGDTLVTCDAQGQAESRQECGEGLCSEDARRCLACDPIGSARCSDRQLFVCSQGPDGEFEASEFCETDELCGQTLQTCGRGLDGEACQCNEGACRPGQTRCNNGQVQRCNEGLTGFDTLASCNPQDLCNPATADCNTCRGNEFSCNNGQMRQCAADGRSFARNVNLECASATQLRVCNGATATTQSCPNGCTNGRGCNQCTGNGVQCVNGNTIRRCVNGFFQDQTCQLGCNAGATQCNACQGNGTSCINGNTQQQCVNGQFVNSNCGQGCVAGRCANCSAAQCINGNQRQACVNGQFQNPTSCSDGNACNGNEGCFNGNCTAGQGLTCNDNNNCTSDSCNPGSGCVFANNNNSCSDGNPCNGNETCGGGRCNPGQNLFCADDGNPCTDNVCSPAAGGCVANQRAGCIACNGPFCIGNIFFACAGGVQGASTNCDNLGQICDPDSNGCIPPCVSAFCDGDFSVQCDGGFRGQRDFCGVGRCFGATFPGDGFGAGCD